MPFAHHLRGALAALPFFAAGQASAQCPATLEDGLRGVLITYNDGSTMASRLRPDGLQEDIETYNDGTDEAYFVLGKAAIFAIEETPMLGTDLVLADRWTFAFPGGVRALPDIVPRLRWDGTFSQTNADGSTAEWSMSVVAGRLMRVDYGGCQFEVIPLVSRTEDEDGFVDFLAYDYVPAVGLAIFRGYSETPQPEEILQIVSFGPYPTQ
jgi:hypothetical protein